MKTLLHILAIIAILAVASSLLPADSFWITDTGNRWIQMESFERTGGEIWIDYPGRSIDPALQFFPHGSHHFVLREGKIASFYGTAFPGVASLLHPFLGDSVKVVLPLAGTLLLLIMTASLAVRLSVSPVASVWLVTFATPVAFYTLTFWEHTLATGLVLLSLWLLLKRSVPTVVMAGAVLGISIVFREEGYIVAVALLLFLLTWKRWVDILAFSAGLLAILGIHWQTLLSVHGSILGPHISVYLGLGREKTTLVQKLIDYTVYLFQFGDDPIVNAVLVLPHLAVFVVLGLLMRGKSPARLPFVVLMLTALSSLCFVVISLIEPDPDLATLFQQGLFPALPLLLPALLGSWAAWRSGLDDALCSVMIVVTLIVTTPMLLHSRDIGIIWGPRHFFHLVPLVVLLALVGFRWLRNLDPEQGGQMRARVAFGCVIAGSVLLQLVGMRALVEKRQGSAELASLVAGVEEGVIVTDVYWLPEELGRMFYERMFVSARTNEELLVLVNQLNRNGIDSFAFVTTVSFGSVSHGLLRQLAATEQSSNVEILGGVEVMIFECDLSELRNTKRGTVE